MEKCDYLIIGSGLYVLCLHMKRLKELKNVSLLKKEIIQEVIYFVIKQRGINIHKYGAHIFHTNDKEIWDYVNSFVEFNRFTNSPLAIFEDKLYNLPFNMNTFHQLWNVNSPEEAREIIQSQIDKSGILKPNNLEEQAI